MACANKTLEVSLKRWGKRVGCKHRDVTVWTIDSHLRYMMEDIYFETREYLAQTLSSAVELR